MIRVFVRDALLGDPEDVDDFFAPPTKSVEAVTSSPPTSWPRRFFFIALLGFADLVASRSRSWKCSQRQLRSGRRGRHHRGPGALGERSSAVIFGQISDRAPPGRGDDAAWLVIGIVTMTAVGLCRRWACSTPCPGGHPFGSSADRRQRHPGALRRRLDQISETQRPRLSWISSPRTSRSSCPYLPGPGLYPFPCSSSAQPSRHHLRGLVRLRPARQRARQADAVRPRRDAQRPSGSTRSSPGLRPGLVGSLPHHLRQATSAATYRLICLVHRVRPHRAGPLSRPCPRPCSSTPSPS